jgi:hypothetical protein
LSFTATQPVPHQIFHEQVILPGQAIKMTVPHTGMFQNFVNYRIFLDKNIQTVSFNYRGENDGNQILFLSCQ